MKKVLIVEDQRMPRENMERILLDSGKYKLCASVNGADVALAVCRREKIDLILMDVCTAGNKDGIEAAAEIKVWNNFFFRNFPIICNTNMITILIFLHRYKKLCRTGMTYSVCQTFPHGKNIYVSILFFLW